MSNRARDLKPGETLRRCDGMYVGTDVDTHPQLKKLLPCLSHEGKPVTAVYLSQLCAEARARGLEVFPLKGCTRADETGRCRGWIEERGETR